jgi:hypothetical protein
MFPTAGTLTFLCSLSRCSVGVGTVDFHSGPVTIDDVKQSFRISERMGLDIAGIWANPDRRFEWPGRVNGEELC